MFGRVLPAVLPGLATAVAVALGVTLALPSAAAAAAPGVIFDTDIGGDVDDVGALLLLHGAQDRGLVRILATMADVSCAYSAPCLNALNTYYGHPEIPVGALKDTGFYTYGDAGYARTIATQYPHALASGADAPDAIALYRRILAGQPDTSVIVVSVGTLRNLANLLKSGADANSPLDGIALVAAKVKLLACMGGTYPRSGTSPEYNFACDGMATQYVSAHWPRPVVFSGSELGGGLNQGREVSAMAEEYNPLTMAYEAYPYVGYGGDRLAWDPTTALFAVTGANGLFTLSGNGYNSVGTDGANTWSAPSGGMVQNYLSAATPSARAFSPYGFWGLPIENAQEDLMIAAKPGAASFDFNTAYYAYEGMGTVTARGAIQPARNAFDRNPATQWRDSAASSWIAYAYGDGRSYRVAAYALTAGAGAGSDPTRWVLEGSRDTGTAWTTLDTKDGFTFPADGARQVFTISNPGRYRKYRFRLGTGGGSLRLGDIELLEHIQKDVGVAVASLALDQGEIALPADARATLNALVSPLNALDPSVTWTSSDTAVALVRKVGRQAAVVRGIKAGKATVTATSSDGGHSASCAVTVSATTLPQGWSFQEVNAPHVPGEARYGSGGLALTGGGMDIGSWWVRDYDQFAWVSRSGAGSGGGDGSLVARITAVSDHGAGWYGESRSDRNANSKAGLMFRDEAGASLDRKCMAVLVSPHAGLQLFWRDDDRPGTDGGTYTSLGADTLPLYLKLEKRGPTVSVYKSPDGIQWGAAIGSHDLAFSGAFSAGLCVTAANSMTTATGEFDNLAYNGQPLAALHPSGAAAKKPGSPRQVAYTATGKAVALPMGRRKADGTGAPPGFFIRPRK